MIHILGEMFPASVRFNENIYVTKWVNTRKQHAKMVYIPTKTYKYEAFKNMKRLNKGYCAFDISIMIQSWIINFIIDMYIVFNSLISLNNVWW